jgi:hypothetical protein
MDNDLMIGAARAKREIVLEAKTWPDHFRVDHDAFCRAFDKFRFTLTQDWFWLKSEDFRDSIFAHFCRLYVMLNSASDTEQRAAARMFQQINETYTGRSLRRIDEEFEENMAKQGFKFVGVVDGIRHYEGKTLKVLASKSPSFASVEKQRKKR